MSNEELYACVHPRIGTFRCVKSQLMKSAGKCPVTGKTIYPEMATMGSV